MIENKGIRTLVAFLFFFVSFTLQGQPGPPPPNPVPISGIEILLGAGALLGAKRFMDGRKGKQKT